ncbi:MAG: AAA family ATPase, partial [Chloroflexi bacterium]|nr:AAA family ATPase [Chloroflexota bacterium]
MLCPSCGRENQPGATFCDSCANKLDDSAGEVVPNDFATSADFVGRQRELGELVSALDDAFAGMGKMVMLVGEPGIGKTRIAQELAAIAEQRGAQVLWGRCYDQQGAPPYWPWVQVIRSYIQQAESDDITSAFGPGAADIAEIVPQLKQMLPDLKASPTLDSPEANRFRLFDSVTTFLKNASSPTPTGSGNLSRTGGNPLVIVLDDLHWSDRPSLLLLEFLARELADIPMLVVATYRDVDLSRGHPLTLSLGELTRQRSFHRISIRGLTQEDVGAFIEAASDIVTRPELVEAIYSRSEGNPLFVEEMVRLISEEEGKWSGRIPEGIREVIGRRLNGLSEDCNRVLTIASVIGREFAYEHLSSLVENISEDGLVDALDEALIARVIEEPPERAGPYQFSHALVQRTLRDELSTTRRVRLHARIADTLEKLYAADLESHASELAYHFGEAEMALGSEKLIEYSKIAGERALAASAYEDALGHFERAMAAKEDQSVDAEMATIFFGLGRAQVATVAMAQAQQAINSLRHAFDAFVDLGDTENAVAVATHPHGFLYSSSGNADMAARALDLVSPDSLEAGYILSRYGAAVSWENKDYEGAQENLDRAVEIARRQGDRVLEVSALVHIAQMRWIQGHFREAIEKILPVIELAQTLGELDALVRASSMCTHALLSLGDGNAAQIHATAGLEAAERLHNSGWLVMMLRRNAEGAILKGEWKAAQEFVARALIELPKDAPTLADAALLNLQVGNLEESSEYIRQILELVPNVPVGGGFEYSYAVATIPLFARVTATTELLDAAESVARETLLPPYIPSIEINRIKAGLALIAIQLSDAESAKEHYFFLESRRGIQELALISYDRLLGLLAQTMGEAETAVGHFEDALAFCRKAGYRPELAWSCYDYAQMLLDASTGSARTEVEKQKAVFLLEEALSISTELGMRPLMERVTALREELEARPTTPPAYPDGLTEREVEVIRLIAAGRSNRQ